jgi:hypothetical protein
MHRDIVTIPPPEAVSIGRNKCTEHQVLEIPGRMLSVQGHPEFNDHVVKVLLDGRFEKGLFGQEVYDDALACVTEPHDGIPVGLGILNFVLTA